MNAKKTSKRLALHRETIRRLQTDELGAVAGGNQASLLCLTGQTCLPSCDCTGYYPSLNAPCTQ